MFVSNLLNQNSANVHRGMFMNMNLFCWKINVHRMFTPCSWTSRPGWECSTYILADMGWSGRSLIMVLEPWRNTHIYQGNLLINQGNLLINRVGGTLNGECSVIFCVSVPFFFAQKHEKIVPQLQTVIPKPLIIINWFWLMVQVYSFTFQVKNIYYLRNGL